MGNLFSTLHRKWRERRHRRAVAVLESVKVRYHTFRVLLANNEYALDLLRSVDRDLLSRNASWSDLSEEIEELMSVTYELVDGVNRLSSGAYKSLYARHDMLEAVVRDELDRLITVSAGSSSCILFDDLTMEAHRGITGGKAATLAFLRRAGLPVPDGFAVSVSACEKIISAAGLDDYIRRRMSLAERGSLSSLEIEDTAAEIDNRIRAAALPRDLEEELFSSYSKLSDNGSKAISVRSSALSEDRAEHSFAGHFKSVLNVASFDGFVEAVKEVVAGGYSARAVLYRLHAGLPLTGRDMAFSARRWSRPGRQGCFSPSIPGTRKADGCLSAPYRDWGFLQ